MNQDNKYNSKQSLLEERLCAAEHPEYTDIKQANAAWAYVRFNEAMTATRDAERYVGIGYNKRAVKKYSEALRAANQATAQLRRAIGDIYQSIQGTGVKS